MRTTDQTATGRGSQPFRTEASMVEHLLEAVWPLFRRRGTQLRFLSEVPIGGERPDLLLAHWSGKLRAPSAPLSAQESTILAVLRGSGSTRIDVLERRCYLAPGSLRDGRFDVLFADGLIDRGRGGAVSLGSNWASKAVVVAIEAKLSKLHRALDQARSYTRYANRAYVAMPLGREDRRQAWFDAVEPSGIGYIHVSASGVRETVAPIDFMLHDWRREYVLSRLLTTGENPGA